MPFFRPKDVDADGRLPVAVEKGLTLRVGGNDVCDVPEMDGTLIALGHHDVKEVFFTPFFPGDFKQPLILFGDDQAGRDVNVVGAHGGRHLGRGEVVPGQAVRIDLQVNLGRVPSEDLDLGDVGNPEQGLFQLILAELAHPAEVQVAARAGGHRQGDHRGGGIADAKQARGFDACRQHRHDAVQGRARVGDRGIEALFVFEFNGDGGHAVPADRFDLAAQVQAGQFFLDAAGHLVFHVFRRGPRPDHHDRNRRVIGVGKEVEGKRLEADETQHDAAEKKRQDAVGSPEVGFDKVHGEISPVTRTSVPWPRRRRAASSATTTRSPADRSPETAAVSPVHPRRETATGATLFSAVTLNAW